MTRFKRRDLIGSSAGAFLLSLWPWQTACAAQVIDVRTWPADEYTRVTIESDAQLKTKYFMLRLKDAPIRLVVDIDGLTLTERLKGIIQKVKPNDPYIANVRCGQFKPNVVRITIDFKSDVQPQIFTLKPAGGYRYRLVFDIYPAEEKDPILAIIKKEESEPDAIGKLLAEVAEGQKRMEENREEAGGDQLAQILAGIESGALTPVKPDQTAILSSQKTTPRLSDSTAARQKTSPKKPTVTASAQKSQKDDARSVKSAGAPKGKRTRTLVVMIDPGHGGEDPGAIGKHYRTREKDVVLAVAKILRNELNKIAGFKALLTRDRDYFVPLQRRVRKARAAKADFFVSIHADAWVKPEAMGSSIFVLNTKGRVSSANNWLARNQNNADLVGGVNINNKDQQLAKILMDMSFTAQVSDSMLYGSFILRELERINKLHKSKVEQANFAVLKAPDIPSVLVETAFLSNPKEERKLRSAAFQRQLACSIGNGILRGFGQKPVLK